MRTPAPLKWITYKARCIVENGFLVLPENLHSMTVEAPAVWSTLGSSWCKIRSLGFLRNV